MIYIYIYIITINPIWVPRTASAVASAPQVFHEPTPEAKAEAKPDEETWEAVV